MNKKQKQKTSFKSKIILLVFVFIGFQSYSQTLDLETCLKMADTANLSLKNARLDIASNQNQISAYKASLLPKVNFNGDYRYYPVIPGNLFPAEFSGGKPGTYTVVQFGVPYTFGNTVQLNQTIYNPLINSALTSLELNQKSSTLYLLYNLIGSLLLRL